MQESTNNSVILITGGGSGIGLATAMQLAKQNCKLILVGRSLEKLNSAKIKILEVTKAAAENIFVFSTDLSLPQSENELSQFLREQKLKLNGFVHSAGAHSVRPFAILKSEQVMEMLNLNAMSAIHASKAALKFMEPGGSVVFVSSAAAIRGGGGVSAYSMAKASLAGLMRCLALEYAGKKMRFNCVLPGVVETEMTQGFFANLSEEQRSQIQKSHPLGLGKPEDVAATIEFLLSPSARWITGTELVVDGGLSCHS